MARTIMTVRSDPAPAILIVADNEVERIGLSNILERAGFRVAAVSDEVQALEFLSHQRPALILLGLLPPKDDGGDLLRYRASEWQAVPVVLLTPNESACPEWARACGAQDYLAKPIQAVEVLRKVRHYCP
jgi:chemosensory pili system protein ChpA (sensor histidine kinase/response regulator)